MKNIYLTLLLFFIINTICSQTYPTPWSKWIPKGYGLELRTRQLGRQENPIYTRWEIEWKKSKDVCGLNIIYNAEILEFSTNPTVRKLDGCAYDSGNLGILQFVNIDGSTGVLNSISFAPDGNKPSSANKSGDSAPDLIIKATQASVNGNNEEALRLYKQAKRASPNNKSIDNLISMTQSTIEIEKTYSNSTNITTDNSLYKKAEKNYNESAREHFNWGLEDYRKQKYKSALGFFKIAKQFAPGATEASEYIDKINQKLREGESSSALLNSEIDLKAIKFQKLDKSPLDITSFPISFRNSNKTIKIIYSRPQVRGRELNSLIPKGEVWRTGANESVEITFYKDVFIGNKRVIAGLVLFIYHSV